VLGETIKDEAGYVCDSCGKKIVLPIDLSAGHDFLFGRCGLKVR
jgi:DNA-directed RNA polymerase subunit RPC12/RpoP